MSGIDQDKTYLELSVEFRQLYPTANYAFQLIPKMYDRLTLVDKLTHKVAIAKIGEDHRDLPGFSGRNIVRYLPADNPNIPRRVRPSRLKPIGTVNNVVPKLSNTESTNLIHRYSNERFSIEYVSNGDLVENRELEEIKKIPDTSSSLVRPEYRILREKFEILSNALARTRQVCFVLFDSNGELVKADADVDHSN
jgi:hypothetical protein